MPSTSKSQQRLMGMAYSLKKGDMDPKDASQEVKDLADSMTLKQLKDFAETSHAGLPDKVEESFEAGKTYTWTGVEWDPKRKNNYKVSKNIEIVKVKPNGDLVGRFEGESSEFIVRQPEKTLKKIKENITIGGMGDVQLPTETEFGSGDVPAGRKNIKKKMKLKNKIATFEQFLVESLKTKEESVVNEAFYRLPKDVIETELYVANKNLQSFYSNVSTGNDVNPKVLDAIIKNLQQVKSLTKKFNKAEEITGTVYEAAGKPAGLTKDETLKVAQKFADAAASVDPKKGKWTVNKKTLEGDSFDLDYNGELGEGGSYNVYQNGDVINMALRENPIIGKKDDDAKTIANGFKKMMNESVNEATLINRENVSSAQTIAAKSKLSYEDSWDAIVSYLVATMGLPKALDLVLKLEKEYKKIFESVSQTLKENKDIKIGDIVSKKYASTEEDYTRTFKVISITGTKANLQDVKTGKKVEIFLNDLIKESADVNEARSIMNESVTNEAAKFKNTQDFEAFLQEIDGMGDAQIKKIMGKNYIDTPGYYSQEAEDYDNDIIEFMISNMGRKEFERLQDYWENNVKESKVNEARSINKIQKDWAKVTNEMAEVVLNWKAAKQSGDAKAEANFLAKLKELTARKKQLEAELDDAVSGKDADLELVVKESLSESKMSDIDLLAQEAKDFKDFVKEFKKDYKHMDTGNPKELEAWLKGVYDAAMEDIDESKN